MDKAERLALAVRVEVAVIRAKQAREPHAVTGERVAKADHEAAVADAVLALREAMALGMTVLRWVGCSAEEYQAAVEAALKD
jgi:hypothetical protein